MMASDYQLYWEDIGERVIYAQLDDSAWKLAEKIFKYKKNNSLYIYHDNRLAAFYSVKDSKKEALLGYRFYSKEKNVKFVISLKKKIFSKVKNYSRYFSKINIKKISDNELKGQIIKLLGMYHEALSVHYLTQPQFFERFEEINKDNKKVFKQIAQARFRYTREAWMTAMNLSKVAFKEYSRRKKIKLEYVESLLYEELKKDRINFDELKRRYSRFLIFSSFHKISLLTGQKAIFYIKKFENFGKLKIVKGIIGNRGLIKAKAFVIKNENLDFKRLPTRMRKGMVLIVQNAWPELSKYYKSASAIITNEGGITSHGVVVARELKIPCIVGTKIATKIFKTGDLVEVDANKGIVRKLKK